MDASDNICKLECVEDNVHEFVGPVKIVFVKPSTAANVRREILTSCVFISNVLLGATLMMVFWFSLFFLKPIYHNIHIFLCTLGGQFLMPIAILIANGKYFGPAMALKQGARRCQHILLQLLGLVCFGGGAGLLFFREKNGKIDNVDISSAHLLSGVVTLALPTLGAPVGILLLLRKSERKTPGILTIVHRTIGIITFLSSSVCFITGILKPTFLLWGGPHLPLVLSGLCAAYTIMILLGPLTNCC